MISEGKRNWVFNLTRSLAIMESGMKMNKMNIDNLIMKLDFMYYSKN